MTSIFSILKALLVFSLNQGFLSKKTWSVVANNKYIIYISFMLLIQFLCFLFITDQAHKRLHREDELHEEIAELKELLQMKKPVEENKIENTPESTSNTKEQFNNLIKDIEDVHSSNVPQ